MCSESLSSVAFRRWPVAGKASVIPLIHSPGTTHKWTVCEYTRRRREDAHTSNGRADNVRPHLQLLSARGSGY